MDSSLISSYSHLCGLIDIHTAYPTLLSYTFPLPHLSTPSIESMSHATTDNTAKEAKPTDSVILEKAFDSIFAGPESSWEHAHILSRDQRSSEGTQSTTSLGYGEILPSSIFSVISELKVVHGELNERGGRLIDLGSGSGRVIFAACLAHGFNHAKGIEYVGSLHEVAVRNLGRWEERERELWVGGEGEGEGEGCEDGEGLSEGQHVPEAVVESVKFEFVEGDITAIPGFTLSPSPTVVFCHATLFDNDLFACVQLICENCPPSTLFVMVTKQLRTGQRTGIETISQRQHKMSWGHATVYLQRRVKE